MGRILSTLGAVQRYAAVCSNSKRIDALVLALCLILGLKRYAYLLLDIISTSRHSPFLTYSDHGCTYAAFDRSRRRTVVFMFESKIAC
jgi:hypothetical protein